MIQTVKIPIGCRAGFYVRWYYNGWHYWNFYYATIGNKTAGQDYRTTAIRTVQISSGPVDSDEIQAIRTLLNSRERYVYTDGGWSECRVESGNVSVVKNNINAFEMECKIVIGSRAVSPLGYSVGIVKPVYIPPNEGEGSPPVDECEIVLGEQIWACKNYDYNYPGSKVYANNEANRAKYGGLYSFAMISQPDFCPAGWRIPTKDDLIALNNYACGVEVEPGIHLRSAGTTYWEVIYETDTMGLDLYGFDWRGAGIYNSNAGTFSGLKTMAYLWSSTPEFYMYTSKTGTAAPVVDKFPNSPTYFRSVRLIKII